MRRRTIETRSRRSVDQGLAIVGQFTLPFQQKRTEVALPIVVLPIYGCIVAYTALGAQACQVYLAGLMV